MHSILFFSDFLWQFPFKALLLLRTTLNHKIIINKLLLLYIINIYPRRSKKKQTNLVCNKLLVAHSGILNWKAKSLSLLLQQACPLSLSVSVEDKNQKRNKYFFVFWTIMHAWHFKACTEKILTIIIIVLDEDLW